MFPLAPEVVQLAKLCAAFAVGSWLLSIVTREYSWVDRLWSVTPAVYAWVVAWQRGFGDPRVVLLAVLTTLWGARLTFNFARKGGYAKGGEDYRWAELRRRMPPAAFQVFNVFFIAGYQHVLLLLIALPIWEASRHAAPLGPLDAALAAAFLAFLAGETVADQQQWNFHQQKKAKVAAGEPIDVPYLDRGLWAWSRHPNFFCEQAQWWVVYAFALAAGAPAVNPTLVGPVLLTLLFHGSTNFTEALSLRKYPSYVAYQRRVSRLVPWPPSRDG